MRLKTLKSTFSNAENVCWSILHQIVTRGLVVIKFFAAARLLGPEAVGLVAIGILSMAIAEALTDTGLQQAVIQNKKRLELTEAGALWTLQATRGIFIFLALIILAEQLARLLNAPAASNIIQATAFVAILKNTVNPGPSLMLRDRNFRGIALYEILATLTDLLVTITLVLVGIGPIAMVIGTAAGETMKIVLSWFPFRTPISPNTQWGQIAHLTNFGKWIWGNSVLTLMLNQIDKILVAKYLGVSELGFYQTAARICQLLIVEPVMALGQYLFPTYAKLFRNSPYDARRRFIKILKFTLAYLSMAVASFLLTSGHLINFALGDAWYATETITKMFVFPMTVGALIAVIIPYLRAIAQPKQILIACLLQLMTLTISAPTLLPLLGASGMIISLGIAGGTSLAYMLFASLWLTDESKKNRA